MGIFDFLTGTATNEAMATTGFINLSQPSKKEISINKSYQMSEALTYSPTTTTTTTNTISPTYTYAPTIISGSPYATATPTIKITSTPTNENPLTISPRALLEQYPNLTQTEQTKKEFAQTTEPTTGILGNLSTIALIGVGGYVIWKLLK